MHTHLLLVVTTEFLHFWCHDKSKCPIHLLQYEADDKVLSAVASQVSYLLNVVQKFHH